MPDGCCNQREPRLWFSSLPLAYVGMFMANENRQGCRLYHFRILPSRGDGTDEKDNHTNTHTSPRIRNCSKTTLIMLRRVGQFPHSAPSSYMEAQQIFCCQQLPPKAIYHARLERDSEHALASASLPFKSTGFDLNRAAEWVWW